MKKILYGSLAIGVVATLMLMGRSSVADFVPPRPESTILQADFIPPSPETILLAVNDHNGVALNS